MTVIVAGANLNQVVEQAGVVAALEGEQVVQVFSFGSR
jgi:hypothetical protein